MEKKKLSLTFKMLRALGFNYSEEEWRKYAYQSIDEKKKKNCGTD